jgi:hypothetical protein
MMALARAPFGVFANSQFFLLWKSFHNRKNWNFYGSDEGGRTAAILTSIATTCKRLRVDSFEYLRDLFQRISTYPQNILDDLLPDKCIAARAITTSQS